MCGKTILNVHNTHFFIIIYDKHSGIPTYHFYFVY